MNQELKDPNKANNIIPAFIKCAQYGIKFSYYWELDKYVYGKSKMFVNVGDAIGSMSHLYVPSDEMIARNMRFYNRYALIDLQELKKIREQAHPGQVNYSQGYSDGIKRIAQDKKLIIETDNLKEADIKELLNTKQS